MMVSPAIAGTSYQKVQPFELPFNAAAGAPVTTPIAQGSYKITATVDCYISIGTTGVAAVLSATQGAAPVNMANLRDRLYANQTVGVDIDGTGWSIDAVAVGTAAGRLTVVGPMAMSANR